MMKLAFSTLGCPEWSFDRVINQAQQMGFSGLEIRGIDGVMRAEEIKQLFPENIADTHSALAERGLTAFCFGASASFHDASTMDAAMDEVRKAIRVCSVAKIPAIRVFGDAIPAGTDRDEVIDRVSCCISELCDEAEPFGVKILLEVHGNFNTIETVGRVIEANRQHSNFGLIWDIAHSDEAYGNEWQPFYELIRPYIHHVHIKDHILHPDGSVTHCLVGEGGIPVREILLRLKADGYDGYCSLEWEKKWVPELPDAEVAFPAYCKWMQEYL